MDKLKILIADDHKLVREGIKITLSQSSSLFEFERMDEASNGEEAVIKAEVFDYDLIFMDINMPIMDGIEATKKIKSEKTRENTIIALSMHSEEFQIKSMIKAGASGYILKNTGLEELNRAIKTVLNGNKYYSNEVALKLLGDFKEDDINPTMSSSKPMVKIADLSNREIQVLRLIASEFTNVEIAKKLKLSRRTIDSHRYNIVNKLHVKNTAGLIKFAMNNNLI
jgi:DNA-binding NarL/FixJ family response regulator